MARRLPKAAQAARDHHAATWIPDKIRPLSLHVDVEAPPRINVVHPSIDLTHFFGGFIAVFNMARKLAERGHKVRMITLEASREPADWRERVARYEGLDARSLEGLEVVSAADRAQRVDVSPNDRFLATHWTAAHVAADAVRQLGGQRFAYLIQEYEPFIFPMGSAAAMARQSYDSPHSAIFSTDLLAGYFERRRIGVFADGEQGGRRNSTIFRNAITPVGTITAESRRQRRRLLFYARPEPHAARNLFELGVMALDEAVADGCFEAWDLIGIGTVRQPGQLTLPRSGARLTMAPRCSQDDYANLLRSADVGLALMYTPHPSLVPIEMASAGMATVTNVYENKDMKALAAISSNLIGAEPTVVGVASALAGAEQAAGDYEARVAGAQVEWPRSWDQALDSSTMVKIERLLDL